MDLIILKNILGICFIIMQGIGLSSYKITTVSPCKTGSQMGLEQHVFE